MKTPFLFAVCVASLLAFSAQDLFAQQRPLGPPAGPASSGLTAVWAAAAEWIQPPSGTVRAGHRRRRKRSPGGRWAKAAGVVAVIDLNHVMNNYVKAQDASSKNCKRTAWPPTPNLRKDNAQIEALKEKLKDFKPGTPTSSGGKKRSRNGCPI